MKRLRYFLSMVFFLFAFAALAQTGVQSGKVERIKVYGKSLEGNLAGDSPERDVSVYLPAGYDQNPSRRYPVVFFLHGFSDSDAKVFGFEPHWMNMRDVLDEAFSKRAAREMIVVTPNAYTRFVGSMYSASATTGNWEEFIARDLVEYIDAHYRTIARPEGRGLSGHSMGGYGALRIGQKFPDVFSAIYLLSPCCLSPGPFGGRENVNPERIAQVKTFDDLNKADFFTKITFASAAAWSPNPQKPPFYLDMPFENGQEGLLISAKWSANQPLATLDQYIFNIKKLEGVAFDAGNEDKAIAASIKKLHESLTGYGVEHFYEEYVGDHLNRVAERIGTTMLPFFDKTLSFEP